MSASSLLLETTIHIDGIATDVTVSDWGELGDLRTLYHFEFHSRAVPPRPIPLSPTGYRSQFVYGPQVEPFADLRETTRAIAGELARQRRAQPDIPGQGDLFG